MTDGTASLPFFASDNPPDINHPAFDFTIVAYVQAPTLIHRMNDPPATFNQRKTNDETYRLSVAPTVWNRFTILGFQATTGKEFDTTWLNRYSEPLRFHRLVWYNYLYYVDRGFDVHTKLHFWATNVAQPFLLEHSPESLDMDTERFTWLDIITHLEKHADRTLWKQVGKHNRNRSPRRRSPEPTPPHLTSPQTDSDLERFAPQTHTTKKTTETEKSADHEPFNPTEFIQNLTTTPHKASDTDMSSESDAKQSAFTMSHEVSTNDGTHRVAFKWKVPKSEFPKLTQNHTHLLSEIYSILGVVFSPADGNFYRWDRDELGEARSIQDMTVAEISEYLAPTITTNPSANMIAFTVRFGFTKNPVSWKRAEEVSATMQANNIQVSASNVKSTDGNLSIAGYILLKHPSMTHRHRYMQYLRRHLPHTTPFFDLQYHRTTPTDQNIAHLAVHCGEKQVTTLCQALSEYLTGQQTAVFLPRYTFATLTTDQIRGHFELHEKFIKSLHQVPLAPMVTALDKLRVEYYADGTTIERTTRDWALTLVLPDGTTHAQCDVVNGGKGKNTYLLVPAAYSSVIKPMVLQYKERLHPISTREAKYRKSIPDLPDVIHITSTVQSNLDYMAKLSNADIWSKAPPSVKSPPYASAPTTIAPNQMNTGASTSSDQSASWPSLVKRPGLNSSSPMSPENSKRASTKGKLKHPMRGRSTQISINSLEQEGDRADTASTHSLTNTLQSIPPSRLMELELEMRECREMLKNTNDTAKDSATRLANTEMHLANTMATLNDLTRNVTGLQMSFNNITRTLDSMRHTLHTIANYSTNTLPYVAPTSLPTIAHPLTTIQESSWQTESDEGGATSSTRLSYRKSPDKKKKRPYNREENNNTANTDDEGDCAMELFQDSGTEEQQHSIESTNETQVPITPELNTQQPHEHTPSPPNAQYNKKCDSAGREDK